MDVAQRIREEIVAGELPFGGRLTMRELADRYGVSHMPIREALRELHGEGLVIIERNRGARVRPVTRRYVENLFSIRSALEIMLTRRAAEIAPPALIATLRRIEDELETCISRRDFPATLAANRAFHQAVYAAADNPEAEQIIARHWLLIAALWRRCGYGPERFAAVASDHRHLIAAFTARDGEAAAILMAAHVLKARQELLARLTDGTPALALSA